MQEADSLQMNKFDDSSFHFECNSHLKNEEVYIINTRLYGLYIDKIAFTGIIQVLIMYRYPIFVLLNLFLI